MTRSLASRALRTLSILASAMLACAACAGGTPTVTAPIAFNCGHRIPAKLRADTPGAPRPAGAASQGAWVYFGDEQTGQLDQANDDKRTGLWIYDQCEAEKQETLDSLTRRTLWQSLTPWRE